MNFKQRIIGIQEWIDHKYYLEDIQFDKEKLFEQKYLNFQIDDCYEYTEKVDGKLRDDIFKNLYSTYLKWKNELINLEISFYLGVWIYNPRLPKSEVVCAVGREKDEYYQNLCFDIATQHNEFIDIKEFDNENDVLNWTQKIDFKTLEEWEINFTKENYENEEHWLNFQNQYNDFIRNSCKIINDKNGKKYFKKVGEIWTGELVKK